MAESLFRDLDRELVNTATLWAGGLAGFVALLVIIYVTLLLRALQNERVIGMAIKAMHDALADGPAPQPALLRAVADVLVAQERAAGRIEVAVHDAAARHAAPPPVAELLRELNRLPEPQLLITDFLVKHGGGRGSMAAFTGIATSLVRAATVEVFSDLVNDSTIELERLLLLADEGRIAGLALAGLELSQNSTLPSYRAPRLTDQDPAALVALFHALDGTTRRHLRLATLLHGQAEVMLRVRKYQRSRGLARLRAWAREQAHVPWLRTPDISRADLAALEVAFDALGEALDLAADHLADGEVAHAIYLLAGLRVPAPAGLPGRLHHREVLAQVRPLAAVGVWHRLAVSRWAASAVHALERNWPPAASACAGARETDRTRETARAPETEAPGLAGAR
ncbi:MAG: hypothetical protein ACLQDY_19300 [Streptosporangiaceae bacterium]